MLRRAIGVAVLAWASVGAVAQTVSIPAEYDKLIQSRTVVGTLGPDLFGDEISFYDGTLQFRQTDVALPGNNVLEVALARRFTVKQDYNKQGAFGDWDWEIPHLQGVFATTGWVVPVPTGQPASAAQLRCSQYAAPPSVSGVGGGTFSAGEFWSGSFLIMPGGGGELLRRGSTSTTPVPADGFDYRLVTKDGSAIRCLSSLAATSTGSGEAFEAVTPNGTRYRFDHMVYRGMSSLSKGSPSPELLTAGAGVARAPVGYLMHRREVWILPTLVTDRFGNTLTYSWSASEPWKLLSISAGDGRTLSLTYVAGSSRVATVSDGTRTWSYEYQALTGGGARLTAVVQPDSARWTFNLEPLRTVMALNDAAMCGDAGYTSNPTGTGTLVHPSGAQGSFTVAEKVQGRSQVPLQCDNYDPANGTTGYSVYPAESLTPSLTGKTLSGPGMPTQTWSYSYGPANNCYLPGGPWPAVGIRCAAGAPGTRTVSVTAPDGAVTRYTFGNRYLIDEGQLLRVDEGVSGSTALRTTVNTYALPTDGPYPNPIGLSLQPRNDGYLAARHTPQRARAITQQSATFTWQVDNTCAGTPYCFDVHARPTKITKSSAPAP